MPAFRCRRWREPQTECLVEGPDLEDWNAPDRFAAEKGTLPDGGVLFVECWSSGAWHLWRVEGVGGFALLTREVSVAEAEDDMRAHGAKPPREVGTS